MSLKGILCCVNKNPNDMPEVLELDYRHSSLSQVPVEVFNWERTLEKLYLSSNQLTDLHPQLFHCHELRELECKDNDLKVIPSGVGNLTKLQRLDASRNVIEDISESIKLCKDLKYLDLSLNILNKVPDGIYQLVGLEEINLSDTYLEYLNANFCRLSKLRVLELRENRLQSLPKSMTRFNHLHRLDLGQNDITEMPEVIASMTNLQELLMDGNSLRRVPSLVGNLHKLNSLDVAGNEVLELADSIGKCVHLNDLSLSTNQIQALPDSFAKLEQLTVLRLDGNQIQYLPQNFGHMKNLQEFTMSKNYLRELPPSIGLLRKLVLLLLDENLLTALPKEIGSCTSLSVLAVARNRIQAVPSEIGHLSNLKVLNLAGNCLQHLPVSILNIPKLGAIWLTEAQSKPLVPLNKEIDPASGQFVITCYLLPQVVRNQTALTCESYAEEGSPDPNSTRTSVIRFADLNYSEEDEEKIEDTRPVNIDSANANEAMNPVDYPRPAKNMGLLRAPTPYPKELRALAKHAAQLCTKHQNSNGELQHSPPSTEKTETTQSPLICQDESGISVPLKSPPPYHIAAMSSRRAAFFASTVVPQTKTSPDFSLPQSSNPRQPEYMKAMENGLGESGIPTPPLTPNINLTVQSLPSEVKRIEECGLPSSVPNIDLTNYNAELDLVASFLESNLGESEESHSLDPSIENYPEFLHRNLPFENETTIVSPFNPPLPQEISAFPTSIPISKSQRDPDLDPTEQHPLIPSFTDKDNSGRRFGNNEFDGSNVQGKSISDSPSPNGTRIPPISRIPTGIKFAKSVSGTKLSAGVKEIESKEPLKSHRSLPSIPHKPSRIPCLASPGQGGRKPWIFGSHRNARVVSLEHKRPFGNPNLLGFNVESLEEGGVAVGSIESDEITLRPGDKILQVDGIDVSKMSLDIVQIILSNCKKTINMLVSREA